MFEAIMSMRVAIHVSEMEGAGGLSWMLKDILASIPWGASAFRTETDATSVQGLEPLPSSAAAEGEVPRWVGNPAGLKAKRQTARACKRT